VVVVAAGLTINTARMVSKRKGSATLASVSGHERPLALRLTAWIVTAQSAGLAVFAVATVVEAIRGDRASATSAALLAVLALVWCAGLVLAARGLLQARVWARAPVVMSEVLMIGIAIPLVQGDQRWLGVAVLVSAVVGLLALFARSVTGELTGR
jgi:hypothetical protein